MKLYYSDSRVTFRQIFFSVRVVQMWNKLSEKVVSAGSVSAFYRAMLCYRGTSHGPVSVSVCVCLSVSVSACHKPVFY